ncbi:MAG TPA: hypothetical protein VIU38_01730 [Anaerolineales bacterium]
MPHTVTFPMPTNHDIDVVKPDDSARSPFRRRLFILVGGAVLCTAIWIVIAVVLTRDSKNPGPVAISTSSPASASSPRAEITSLASPVPAAGGLTDDVLRGRVWATIMSFYSNVRGCAEVSSQEISVAVPRDATGSWVEAWTVTACSETQVLHIQFTTDSEGGVRYDISE